MKTFIFLVFSILIHCYIFQFSILGNGQDSHLSKLFLRSVKQPLQSKDQNIETKTSAPIATKSKFDEPSLFAPKKLTAHEISRLDYRSGLIYLVQSKAVYPMIAQDLEQKGTVVLAIELNKDGQIITYKLHEKTKYDLLNEAALNSVVGLKTYKPLPKVLYPRATFLVPIHFFNS